jgi:pimeloyl-ACP methyl ester carboxylesterase
MNMSLIEGRYIGAGEKNLFVKMSGLGDPPVVIETALGSISSEWWQIQEKLAEITTVITYDRAGYAESPKRKTDRNTKEISMELFNMLSNTEVPGPYIIVGHSIGGLIAQHFTKMFTNQVAGLVLVDSLTVNEPEFDELDAPVYQENLSINKRLENIKKLLELDKEDFDEYVTPMLQNLYVNFPDEIATQILAYQTDKQLYETIIREYDSLKSSISMIKDIKEFPNIPIKVLCRDFEIMVKISKEIGLPEDEAKAVEELWLAHSKKLLDLSNNSEFVLVKNSNHSMHLSRPDAIIEQVTKLIDEIKAS